jgi:hypothetical protein
VSRYLATDDVTLRLGPVSSARGSSETPSKVVRCSRGACSTASCPSTKAAPDNHSPRSAGLRTAGGSPAAMGRGITAIDLIANPERLRQINLVIPEDQ